MKSVKRPLAIIGFSFLATSCITLTVPKEYSVILLALFTLLLIVHYLTAKRYTKQFIITWLTAICSLCYTGLYCQGYQSKIDAMPRQKQSYSGYITQKNSQSNPAPYTMQVVDTNDKNKEIYSLKFFSDDEFIVGDTITIEGKFSPFKASYYTFASYFRDVIGNVNPSKISKSDIKINSYRYLTINVKQKLLSKAEKLYSNNVAPLVWSMGYSDKSLNTQGHLSLFEAAGISHTLVVSGFHIVILVAFINAFIFYIPISKKIKNIIAAMVIFIFISIIGFSPSIVRAGVITMIVLVLTNLKQETDGLTNLGLMALVTTISSPYAARDIGLLLSYSACIGIIASGYISKKKNLQTAKANLLATTMAVVFTLPILSFAGMKVTLLSPVFNLVLLPFVSIACGLSFFTPILGCLGIVGKLFNFILVPLNTIVINFLLLALEMINRYFSFALVNLGQEKIFILLIGLVVGVAVGFAQFKNIKVVKIFALSLALTSLLCYNFLNSNIITVTAFDSGREASFLVNYKGENSLILSEFITAKKITAKLSDRNGAKYSNIFLCTKDGINTDALQGVTDNIIDMSAQASGGNDYMHIKSKIDVKQNTYYFSLGKTTFAFGHKKVELTGQEMVDFYFLGNDKPKSIVADNIFIFGNTPKWMDIRDIQELSTDLTIKINLKTNKYKIVKDVYNFGY